LKAKASNGGGSGCSGLGGPVARWRGNGQLLIAEVPVDSIVPLRPRQSHNVKAISRQERVGAGDRRDGDMGGVDRATGADDLGGEIGVPETFGPIVEKDGLDGGRG
jgi:hypothetical protein